MQSILTPTSINHNKAVNRKSNKTNRQNVLLGSDIFLSTAKVANDDSSLLLQ